MNYKCSTFFLAAALGSALLLTSANAALVTIDSITGFSGGDSATAGDFTQLTNGNGIDKSTDANDPSTWVNNGAIFQEEWYDDPLTGAANSKLGWVSFDLGSARADLETLFIFNGNWGNPLGQLSSKDINVYYSTNPTVALPTGVGPNGTVDYDFSSGGWTSLTSTTLTQASSSADEIDLSGISSAQYIGIELMDFYVTSDDRLGFDEVAITAVPEPSAFALLAGMFGLTWVMLRRRG